MRQLELGKIDDIANTGRTVVGFQQAARIVDAYGDRAGSGQVTGGREGSRANLADLKAVEGVSVAMAEKIYHFFHEKG